MPLTKATDTGALAFHFFHCIHKLKTSEHATTRGVNHNVHRLATFVAPRESSFSCTLSMLRPIWSSMPTAAQYSHTKGNRGTESGVHKEQTKPCTKKKHNHCRNLAVKHAFNHEVSNEARNWALTHTTKPQRMCQAFPTPASPMNHSRRNRRRRCRTRARPHKTQGTISQVP